jgi:hypothetical protein
VLAGAHGVLAAVLLIQPPAIIRRIIGDQGVPPSWIIRLLGARTLVQGAAEALHPSRNVLVLGVAIDLTHGASMLAAAAGWPRYRRAALISAVSVATSAVVGAVLTGLLR